MYKSLIEAMKNDWIENGDYKPPLMGCSPEELENIRVAQEVNYLPELYRQFMLIFGKESGGLKTECEFRFPDVLTLKQQWISILPSSDCFVFGSARDSTALFFLTESQNDDPLVCRIGDSSTDEPDLVIETWGLLSDQLIGWVASRIEVYQKWR